MTILLLILLIVAVLWPNTTRGFISGFIRGIGWTIMIIFFVGLVVTIFK